MTDPAESTETPADPKGKAPAASHGDGSPTIELADSSKKTTSRDKETVATPLASLPPEQLAELLSKNPALANEFAAMSGTGSSSGSPPPPKAFDAGRAGEFLTRLSLQDAMTGLAATGKGAKDMASYKFWQTQPVPKFGDLEAEKPDGPIKIQTLENVPKSRPKMADGFEWVTLDLNIDSQLKEVYDLLNGHYVEDDEAMFRFNYSPSILRWALMSPGWKKQWHIGVRTSQSRKLVAFISAIPCTLRVRESVIKASEVNFICVHKKLRGKRLAPVLIKEITRLVNLDEVWQAIYTAGVVLPRPISTARYFHRALNWQKLYEVGFSPCPSNSKPQFQVRKYHLPDRTSTKGLREMQAQDVDAVHDLVGRYLKRFDMTPIFDREEVKHWLLNMNSSADQFIFSYVVETDGKITDFFSFYDLESSVINNPRHSFIRAAYLFYYATEAGLTSPFSKNALSKRLNEILHDALILARQNKFDVFNALSLMDNALFLEQQKFGAGDGQLHYYLFNYFARFIPGGVDGRNQLDKDNLSRVGFVML